MPQLNDAWVSASSHESYGKDGDYGVKVFVQLNRDLTEAEKSECYKFTHNFIETIRKENKRLEPDFQSNIDDLKEEILRLFPKNEVVYCEQIPNEYCSQGCCLDKPWFIVTTSIGRIKIGWRKRVLSIGWGDSKQEKTSEELFPAEDVTKYDFLIHAWGYDKAKEYLLKIIRG